jgi:hypothetical protein
LGWTFGATRGTALRLAQKNESNVILKNVMDSKKRKFQTKIALRNTDSERKLSEDTNIDTSNPIPPASKGPTINIQSIEKTIHYLNRLLEINEGVSKLINEIHHADTLQRFLELKFGLEQKEKTELEELVNKLMLNRGNTSPISGDH